MTQEEMIATLETLPMKTVLIPIGKQLNHGTFGFDYLKDKRTKTRPALARYLIHQYYLPETNQGRALIETFKAHPYRIDLEERFLRLPKPASTDPIPTGAPTNPTSPQRSAPPTPQAGESRPPTSPKRGGQIELLSEALMNFIPCN